MWQDNPQFFAGRAQPDRLTQELDRLAGRALTRSPDRRPRRARGVRNQWRELLRTVKADGTIKRIRRTPYGRSAEVEVYHRHAAHTLLQPQVKDAAEGIFRVPRIDAIRHPADASRATLRLFRRDLLRERAGAKWPGIEAPVPRSLWDPIEFGWDELGEPVRLLVDRHVLLAGETRSGKSVAQSMIVATAALSDARIFLMDANRIQLSRWKAVAESFVVDDMDEAVATLERLVEELDRRTELVEATGADKLDRDLSRELGLPPIVLVIDEGADYLENRQFMPLLTKLCRRSAAFGFRVVFATQSPNATIIPTPLRNNMGLRAVFRVADRSASGVALGSSSVDASSIAPEDRGVCFLHQDGVQPSRMRTFYPTPDQVRRLCSRAIELRGGK